MTSSDVYAAGFGGIMLHYDGKAWSEMASGTHIGLNAIWGTSPTDIFAAGDGDTILHYSK